MVSVLVDQDLCTRCGICSSVCVMGIINPADENSLPKVNKATEGTCIRCGHCEAYCPSQALRLSDRPDEEILIPAGAGIIAPEDVGYYLKKRRSVRHYTRDPVAQEKIDELLDITRFAASAGNGQPVEWIVIHDPDKVKEVAALTIEWMKTLEDSDHPMSGYIPFLVTAWESGRDVICRGAPHLLVATIPEGSPMAQTDAIIALTHFDIAAPAFGLGTCWAGFVAMAAACHEPLRLAMGIPPGRKSAYAMMLGYPRYTVHGIPSRKPLAVTWR